MADVPRAKKRFGQHFLHDAQVVARIVAAFAPKPADCVVEIGPGPGALTKPLLDALPHLHVVELDRDWVERLRQAHPPARLQVHAADALSFDFAALAPAGGQVRLIGNLPYNISTPLLFHLIAQRHAIHDMLFMLQREVVERLVAAPGGKDYGRLSVMVQWYCDIERVLNVGAGAFRPPPKVESAVVRLRPRAPRMPVDEARFAQVVQAAFATRRKTLRNSLRDHVAAETMQRVGIDPTRRAETLSLEEFARLSQAAP